MRLEEKDTIRIRLWFVLLNIVFWAAYIYMLVIFTIALGPNAWIPWLVFFSLVLWLLPFLIFLLGWIFNWESLNGVLGSIDWSYDTDTYVEGLIFILILPTIMAELMCYLGLALENLGKAIVSK